MEKNGRPTEDAPLSSEQFRKEMQSLIEAIQKRQRDLAFSNIDRFFASGVFFIFLGLVFLVAAFFALESGVHTSFSFVLVVLGVAILLFGTGTQGIGKLESETTTAKFNIAIAGGAGALAIAIGWGMTYFGPQMQSAFAQQTRYVAAELRPHDDSNSSFQKYWGQFESDGQPIPSVLRGKYVFVYIPYTETQRYRVKRIEYVLSIIKTDSNLEPEVKSSFQVPLSEVNPNNSGSDFPIYDNIPPIDMRSEQALNALLKAGGSQTQAVAPGAAPPNPPPPVDLGGH